jgi:hypothetical protein
VLLARCALAQFTLLGEPTSLINTSKPEDGFSIQDKLVPCNSNLVLIDLDSDASFKDFPPQFTLQKCGASSASRRIQEFAVDPVWGQVSLASPPPYLFPGTCVDGGGAKVNISIYPWLCRDASLPLHSNQRWTFANGQVFLNSSSSKYPLPAGGLCMTAGLPGQPPVLEAGLVLALCDPAQPPSQAFFYSASDGTLRHAPTGLCVDAGVIGRTLTWDGSNWRSNRIVPKNCPDAGNPALLPRDRIGAYTVGHTRIGGDPTKGDRLLIVGGDDTSQNMYWSDDCGKTWLCFDGKQPWTKFGVSFAPLLTLDALPGAPLVMAGGFDNTPDGDVALSAALYYTFDGGAGTWKQGYDLPTLGVFPGSLAQDRAAAYVFGGADSGFAVWSVDERTYNTSGFKMIPGSAFAQGADVGRRVYIRGRVSGGCFFATDFSPGVLWGAQPRDPPVSSSNRFSVAAAATGPWATFKAPWEPRASAAVVSSRDGTLAYVAGGVNFSGGVPTGEALADAWSIDARACLLGSNGALCSGHGTPDVDTATCGCDAGWDGTPTCDGPASASASPSPSPTRSATRTQSPSRSSRATPAAGAKTQTNAGALSPSAAAGLSLGLVALCAGGALWLYVARWGGGPSLAVLAARVGLRKGAGGERAGLLRAQRGSPTVLSPAAAAARFGAI